MAHEYRYPLTRVCLRGGNMTLPRTMIGLFPDEGEVTVVDTLTGEEHEAYMSSPRVVSGLGTLYLNHDLDVNDELLVTRLGEGRFGVTAMPRVEPGSGAAEQAEADEQDPALTAEEEAHGQSHQEAEYEPVPDVPADVPADVAADLAAEAGGEAGAHTQEGVAPHETEPTPAQPEAPHEPADSQPERTSLDPRLAVHEAESALSELESESWRADPQQATLWDAGRAATGGSDAGAAAAEAEASEPPAEAGPADQPVSTDPPPAPAPRQPRGPAYTEAEEDAAALAAVALSSRLRRAFTRLGYRIEPLATGVHFLHAEMGRRRYKVLVQLLRSGERLDWAGLLSRRRNSPANYMAVVGDRADLIRLSHPAELARATLWSWDALERLDELHGSVPVTPLDLESHFARDGLFEAGLKRFEQGVAARVAERGAASEVLTRLARNRAPSVFLLEELAQDVNLSRDLVLRILERFSEAPMHLVAKVDSGEFLLRQPVDTALAALASYADSLRQRLPVGRREVFTGLDDEELGSGLLDEVAVETQTDNAPAAEESHEGAADPVTPEQQA